MKALATTTRALSAFAVQARIAADGGKVDVATISRILTTLKDLDLVRHIGVSDGYFPRPMTEIDGSRSEVFVSKETGVVTDLQLPSAVVDAINSQVIKLGFHALSIKVEIVGESNTITVAVRP